MAKMEWWEWVAILLVSVGAINWGLVGLLDFNLVTTLFVSWFPLGVKIIYALVGISGLYSLWFALKQAF